MNGGGANKRKREEKSNKGKKKKRRRTNRAPITEAEIDATIKPQHCYCVTTAAHDMAYVGYTVKPSRRVRSHAREIKGGARRTAKMHGDVHYFVIVGGFLCKRDALQFEWAWNKGRCSKPSRLTREENLQQPTIMKEQEQEQEQEGKEEKKARRPKKPVQKLLARLFELLASARWTKKAVPTNHPWREKRHNQLTVTWKVDPRCGYGLDPATFLVALPVLHRYEF